MSEPRKIEVILRNSRGFKPRDRRRLLSSVKRIARYPCDVRVSPSFVEVVFFGNPKLAILRELGEVIGDVVEVVEGEPVPEGPNALDAVKGYLKEGLYWRAHVAGEEAWHRGGGEEARALALIAGALAKAQEGNERAARKILRKALKAGGWGVDYECLEKALSRVAAGELVDAGACMKEEWLKQVLSPLMKPGRMPPEELRPGKIKSLEWRG